MSATECNELQERRPVKEHHPLTRYLPEAAIQSDLEMLIAQGGLDERIVLVDDKIIEGRVRERACVNVGVQPNYRTWDGEGDPFIWMVRNRVTSHNLDRDQTLRLAADLLPYFKMTPGSVGTRLAEATGLGQHTVRKVVLLVDRGLFDRVLAGDLSWNDALRHVGYSVPPAMGKSYGKGDPFVEATEPMRRYMKNWRKKGFEFRHVNPREAARRLIVLDELTEALAEARADLERRAVRPRHSTK